MTTEVTAFEYGALPSERALEVRAVAERAKGLIALKQRRSIVTDLADIEKLDLWEVDEVASLMPTIDGISASRAMVAAISSAATG